MAESGFKFILNKISSFLDPENVFADIFRSVDPLRWLDEWGREDTQDETLPEHLMLRLADKEDIRKIEEFFNSRNKESADPNNFVKPRKDEEIRKVASAGKIVIIEDHNHDIVTVCFGFTHKVGEMPEHETPRVTSEMGTVLSSVKGLGLPSIAISALALLIAYKDGEDQPLIAKVSKENDVANGLFAKALKWEIAENKKAIRSLFNSSVGDTIRESDGISNSIDEATESRNWYYFGGNATDNAKEILQELFKTGYIIKNDKKIIFEFDKDDLSFELNEDDDRLTKELDEIFDDEGESAPAEPIPNEPISSEPLSDKHDNIDDLDKHLEEQGIIITNTDELEP